MYYRPKEKEPRKTQFLAISLGLVFLLILGLVLMLVTYRWLWGLSPTSTTLITSSALPTMPPSATPSPISSPTITRTPYPSLTLTITQTPTQTSSPTLTPTPTGLPTLTPARPVVYQEGYKLATWSAEQMDYTVRLLQDYPNSLPADVRGEDNAAYYQAFSYAVFAQQEALLRYPDAPQADSWRWNLAYNLALMGDENAGRQYADLIVAALNSGQADIPNLYAWFRTKEPRLALFLIELKPINGFIGSYLVEVRGNGSAFIWLVQTTSAYRAYVLWSNFDTLHSPQANWIVTDLNGIPGDEVAIYFNQSNQLQLQSPRVFRMAKVPQDELFLLPGPLLFDVGFSFTNYWVAVPNPLTGYDLRFESQVFPSCPIRIQRTYHWNGLYFELSQAKYSLDFGLLPLSFCEMAVDKVAESWGPQAAIPLAEAILPFWPPAQDINGKAYPLDAKDAWRYRLGVYYALAGQFDAAHQTLREIVEKPSFPSSRWISPAKTFIDVYQKTDDIYRACIQASFCEPRYAVEYLVSLLPSGSDALGFLRRAGVSPYASGYFDFDGDHRSERWFTVRHQPLGKLEFWFLMDYKTGVQAVRVGYTDAKTPLLEYLEQDYISPEGLHLQPAVFLDDKIAFYVARLPNTYRPYIIEVPLRKEYPSLFYDTVEAAEKALFEGSSAESIRKILLDLLDWPGAQCKPSWNCDKYLYLLGLSTELAGHVDAAVSFYHRLWLDYSKSPFTWIARLKLVGQVYFTPTPTSTITPTLTLSPTITLTPSPTVTGTPPTATPSPSFTPTVSGTPSTATPTPTVTVTPTSTTPAYP